LYSPPLDASVLDGQVLYEYVCPIMGRIVVLLPTGWNWIDVTCPVGTVLLERSIDRAALDSAPAHGQDYTPGGGAPGRSTDSCG